LIQGHSSIRQWSPLSEKQLLLPFNGCKSGCWSTYPSETYYIVSWDDDIPNIWQVIKVYKSHVPVTTNQYNHHIPIVVGLYPMKAMVPVTTNQKCDDHSLQQFAIWVLILLVSTG